MTLRRLLAVVAPVVVAAFVTLTAGTARADFLPDCGNLDLTSTASCQLQTSGGCTASCTPINFTAQCSATVEAMCSGGCTGGVDVSCTGSCTGSCMASCTGNPGGFNCQASCDADAMASCSGQCASSNDMTTCTAQCQASISARCNASCSVTPPMVDCMAGCQAACQGSCTAQSNLSCDLSCQAKLYAGCTSMLTGGCTANCMAPMGALFCNGQFVDVDQNALAACENELSSLINVQVSGEASCSGDECMAMAKGSISCAVASPGLVGTSVPLVGIGLALAMAALVIARRRRGVVVEG